MKNDGVVQLHLPQSNEIRVWKAYAAEIRRSGGHASHVVMLIDGRCETVAKSSKRGQLQRAFEGVGEKRR